MPLPLAAPPRRVPTFDVAAGLASSTRSLIQLGAGEEGWLAPSDLPPGDRQLLHALGLVVGRRIRLRKTGSPWIVEVRGVRIGLSLAVARRLRVLAHAGDGSHGALA